MFEKIRLKTPLKHLWDPSWNFIESAGILQYNFNLRQNCVNFAKWCQFATKVHDLKMCQHLDKSKIHRETDRHLALYNLSFCDCCHRIFESWNSFDLFSCFFVEELVVLMVALNKNTLMPSQSWYISAF